MKKRIYYIVSSIIQILIALYTIIFSNKFLAQVINSYRELYEETQNSSWLETIKLYENIGESLLIVLAIITIILYGIILYNLFTKKEKYIQSKMILIVGIICFFTSESLYISILSLVNVIVWFFGLRKTNVESYKDNVNNNLDNNEIPKLEKRAETKKTKLLAIIAVITFFFLPDIISLLSFSYIFLSIILDVLLILICLLIFYPELKRDFKIFLENKNKYLKFIINKQITMFFIYYLVVLVVVLIKGDNAISVNQQVAESLPMLYIIPTCLIYAPFVEELIFRVSIRRFIKNDKIFIVVSGLFFGLLHTMSEATLFNMIVLSLPYAVLGSFFAYLLVKTENTTISIMSHFIHNAFACLMMLIG
ncbi:MAG: CPBP family intramembrane metalloprotease [Firmicutes bacterium]|nr:CPBP family intramembrane metalloprotease [Bacillota bacterium]